jgi:hypothetical protein
MLSSSYSLSTPLWLDLSSDIGSIPVVGIPVEPLPVSENYAIPKGISSVVVVN